MATVTSKQEYHLLFKKHQDPSDVERIAKFSTSLLPTALTYTMGAMRDTKGWSGGFEHPDVSTVDMADVNVNE